MKRVASGDRAVDVVRVGVTDAVSDEWPYRRVRLLATALDMGEYVLMTPNTARRLLLALQDAITRAEVRE